jgi:hypothetical protein
MAKAFIPYSIAETDAHLVYEIGDLLKKQGFEVEYNWDMHNGQQVYDEVAQSQFFVGMVTHPRYQKQVTQLWQYALSQHIPAYLIVEDKIALPGTIKQHPSIHVFRRYLPQNPVRFIEAHFSHR